MHTRTNIQLERQAAERAEAQRAAIEAVDAAEQRALNMQLSMQQVDISTERLVDTPQIHGTAFSLCYLL